MSSFTFLKTDWPELYETAREAEQNVASAPLSHRLYARSSLERAVKWLYVNDSYLKQLYADNLAALGFDFAQPPVDFAQPPLVARSLSGAEGNSASSPRSSPSRNRQQKTWRHVGTAPTSVCSDGKEENFGVLYHIASKSCFV